jgi:hypothetical protein
VTLIQPPNKGARYKAKEPEFRSQEPGGVRRNIGIMENWNDVKNKTTEW